MEQSVDVRWQQQIDRKKKTKKTTLHFELTNQENVDTFIEIEKSGKRTGLRKMLI